MTNKNFAELLNNYKNAQDKYEDFKTVRDAYYHVKNEYDMRKKEVFYTALREMHEIGQPFTAKDIELSYGLPQNVFNGMIFKNNSEHGFPYDEIQVNGLKFRKIEVGYPQRYRNVDNPNDIIEIVRKRMTYYPQ